MSRKVYFLAMLPVLAVCLKLIFLWHYGSGVPHSDEWDDYLARTFTPISQGRYSLAQLFAAHSEHRVVWSRLSGVAVWLANGRVWNPFLELVVNAAWYSLFISFAGYKLAGLLAKSDWPLLFTCLLLILVLPVGWENALCGFQGQQYFLTAFSITAIWLCLTSRSISGRWWLGYLSCICALFTVASGCFVSLVLAIATIFTGFRGKTIARTLFLLTFFTGLAMTPHVAANDVYHATGFADFALAFFNCLAWPWIVFPFMGILLMSPILPMAGRFLKGQADQRETILCAVLGWLVLQSLAIAYARGVHAHPPMFRYQDYLAFLPVIVLLCVKWRWLRFVYLLGALALSGRALLVDIPQYNAMLDGRKRLALEYLATHDPHVYDGRPVLWRMYPNDDISRTCYSLDEANQRGLLPKDLKNNR